MKLADMAIDVDRQENGAWVDDISEMAGLRLKVRGANNADWRALQSKLFDALPRKQRMGRIDLQEAEAMQTKLLLETSLLDWDGLEDGDKPVPYSKEIALMLLTDPRYRKFRDFVVQAANLVAEKVKESEADTVGNLVKLSGGNTDSERNKKAG